MTADAVTREAMHLSIVSSSNADSGDVGRQALLHVLELTGVGDVALAAVCAGIIFTCFRDINTTPPSESRLPPSSLPHMLAADASILRPLLSLASGDTSSMTGDGGSALSQWVLLIVEEFVRAGAVAAAFSTAGTGIPISLAAVDLAEQYAASSVEGHQVRAKITLQQATLLHFVEAVTEGDTVAPPSTSAQGISDSAKDSNVSGKLVLRAADACALASAINDSVAEIMSIAGFAAVATRDTAQMCSAILRPLLLVVSMLCDIASDTLVATASTAGGDGGDKAVDVPPAGAALQLHLMCASQLASVLHLLAALTPPPPPAPIPPPSEEGEPTMLPADATATSNVQEATGRSSGIVNSVASVDTILPVPHPAVAAASAVLRRGATGGARTSLTRFVALAVHCVGEPAAAAILDVDGGVFVVLNQCVITAADPLLREWGLMAVRNLCAASPDRVPALIARLRVERVASAPELGALGVKGR